MPEQFFTITAQTVGNEILETPISVPIPCAQAVVRGFHILRDFDSIVENIVAINVLLIEYGGQLFGTTDFKTVDSFNDYRYGKCVCCEDSDECGFVLNSCLLTVNGCTLN